MVAFVIAAQRVPVTFKRAGLRQYRREKSDGRLTYYSGNAEFFDFAEVSTCAVSWSPASDLSGMDIRREFTRGPSMGLGLEFLRIRYP